MLKQVIVIRSDLKMGRGKACAQAAHASLEAYLKTAKKNPRTAKHWIEQGMAKIVVKVSSEEELWELYEKTRKKFPAAVIRDAGCTQLKPGKPTCFAAGPASAGELDVFFGELKLF